MHTNLNTGVELWMVSKQIMLLLFTVKATNILSINLKSITFSDINIFININFYRTLYKQNRIKWKFQLYTGFHNFTKHLSNIGLYRLQHHCSTTNNWHFSIVTTNRCLSILYINDWKKIYDRLKKKKDYKANIKLVTGG